MGLAPLWNRPDPLSDHTFLEPYRSAFAAFFLNSISSFLLWKVSSLSTPSSSLDSDSLLLVFVVAYSRRLSRSVLRIRVVQSDRVIRYLPPFVLVLPIHGILLRIPHFHRFPPRRLPVVRSPFSTSPSRSLPSILCSRHSASNVRASPLFFGLHSESSLDVRESTHRLMVSRFLRLDSHPSLDRRRATQPPSKTNLRKCAFDCVIYSYHIDMHRSFSSRLRFDSSRHLVFSSEASCSIGRPHLLDALHRLVLQLPIPVSRSTPTHRPRVSHVEPCSARHCPQNLRPAPRP